MLLINQNQTAIHPFPCPVNIEKYGSEESHYEWRIVVGQYSRQIFATYTSPVPAKMEIKRLMDEWENAPRETHEFKTFQFVKDVRP